jgi:SEC-C motif domain protein
MRSRFSAFAKKEAAYLYRTLHPDHEDRARPEADVLRDIHASASACRYLGLTVLDRIDADEEGIARVRFRARVFTKGRDVSFVELSEFAHDGEGWRYLRGTGR